MNNHDVKLIQQVLAGDESAFAALVNKYKKPIHALAWRKIGDFHIAEEITQDTFLKAYQRLHTLKDPYQFSGWLYVIATRRCYAWLRKKRIHTQPLEDAETTMGQSDVYSQHVIDERKNTAAEAQRDVVKKLLAKLKESERTVMTLYYLGEMTVEEISKFIGVSAGTIKSRLQRARHRLQKEETMIREALEHFQISPNLTDNIMQEISRLKPAPSTSKPLLPWAIAASSAILIVMLLGIGSQKLLQFQQPYSLDAQTEMTVELVDTPVVLNVNTEPDIQNQLSNPNVVGKSNNNGQKPDEVLLAAAQVEGEDVFTPKLQWIQSEPVRGSHFRNLHATPDGDLYAIDIEQSLYKLPANGMEWLSIYKNLRLDNMLIEGPFTKWNNTLYYIPANKLFASRDEGKTWDLLYTWQEGIYAKQFLQMEQALYLAFNNGIYKSEDSGKTWEAIHNEKKKQTIESIFKVQNTLFVRTYNDLYRVEDDKWTRLVFPVPVRHIISDAASEDKLYIAVLFNWEKGNVDIDKIQDGLERGWWIFRSTDLGNSWKDITPSNAWSLKGWPPNCKLIAAGETLLVMEEGMVRSNDAGNTWMPPQLPGTIPPMHNGQHQHAAVIENAIYVGSQHGLHRSTDGGKTWDMIKIAQDKTRRVFRNLIVHTGSKKMQSKPPTLYGIVDVGFIVKTTDEGKTWKDVQFNIPMNNPVRLNTPRYNQIITSGDDIYAKTRSMSGDKFLYRVSEDGNTLTPINGMPTFNWYEFKVHLYESQTLSIEELQEKFSGATQFFKQMLQVTRQQRRQLEKEGLLGPFAVSGDTFYYEYNFKLFRWQQGETEWYDTGLEDFAPFSFDKPWLPKKYLKLAVSGDTVYAGKRDGHLVVSFDRGNNWVDLTPDLPFKVNTFEDIVFVGNTVYVATDAGIITSDDGRSWQVVADFDGKNLIMEHLATEGTTLYGITKMTPMFPKNAVFRLENDTWTQIVSIIPGIIEIRDIITSFAVVENTLYVGTERNGMLHYTFE